MLLQHAWRAMIGGLLVWAGATLFFIWLGDTVLVEPEQSGFWLTICLLEAGTACLLYLVLILYRLFDSAPHAGVRLGVWGTAIGLLLDSVLLFHHDRLFPDFTEGQLLSFMIWMVIAYFLYLLIPLLVERQPYRSAS
ncbi:DUF5367 family protein [Brevibacillus humidisoli]|uniref:DUF5367 family protein n=1 Tax=Brevibacillus humidisoli TaxID=2895522 RepID=UPI001E51EBF8|nr:DUF5367 family protein [Brevibacillus humidisoli]UFJ40863.1 DUF5367 family protein [Brevibacillus humidisoli]